MTTARPWLLIAGGKDHIAPFFATKANFKLYRKSKGSVAFLVTAPER